MIRGLPTNHTSPTESPPLVRVTSTQQAGGALFRSSSSSSETGAVPTSPPSLPSQSPIRTQVSTDPSRYLQVHLMLSRSRLLGFFFFRAALVCLQPGSPGTDVPRPSRGVTVGPQAQGPAAYSQALGLSHVCCSHPAGRSPARGCPDGGAGAPRTTPPHTRTDPSPAGQTLRHEVSASLLGTLSAHNAWPSWPTPRRGA